MLDQIRQKYEDESKQLNLKNNESSKKKLRFLRETNVAASTADGSNICFDVMRSDRISDAVNIETATDDGIGKLTSRIASEPREANGVSTIPIKSFNLMTNSPNK